MDQPIRSWMAAAAATAAAAGLLFFSPYVSRGVAQGLTLCGQTLIPSLFPFMVLAVLISRSRAARPLCRLLGPLCRRWLRLPQNFGPVLLISLIGGYPVGARILSGMLDRNEATPQDARRFLQFSVSPAPSFAMVTVGAALLGSPKAGAVIYGCHLFTGLLLGGWLALRSGAPKPRPTPPAQPLAFGTALVESTAAAVEGMLSICGFVLLFSALLSLLEGLGLTAAAGRLISELAGKALPAEVVSAALSGILEVTCGLFACRGLPWKFLCVLLPFLVSFGSLSVLCQLSAGLRGRGIGMGSLLTGRLVHGLLCSLMAAPLLYRMQPSVAALAQLARPLARPDSILSTLALLGMCSLLLFSLGEKAPPKL